MSHPLARGPSRPAGSLPPSIPRASRTRTSTSHRPAHSAIGRIFFSYKAVNHRRPSGSSLCGDCGDYREELVRHHDVQAKGCHLRAGATSRRKAGRRAVCHGGAFAGLIASPLNPLLRPGQCGRRCATPSHDVCRQVFPPPALPKPTGLASLWRNLVTCGSDAKLEKDYAVLIAQSIASAVAKARAEAATSLEQAPLVSLGRSLGSARRCLALSRVGARKL